MHAADDRLAFAPPPQPGLLRAFSLAVAAHVLLALALMHGLQWQRETQDVGVEAELWSALPQQAAPPPVVAPPPPPPQPVVKAPPPPPAPEPPVQRDADIALEKEKQKRELEKKKLAEERELQRKKELAAKKREEELAQKKREEALAKQKLEQQKKQQLAEAKRKEDEKKRKEEEARELKEAQRREQLRREQIARIQGMAGGGTPSDTGTAARSSGPSSSYAGRVAALIKRNTRFVEAVAGDPAVEVEIRLAPDGTIVGQRLIKSSGNKARDEAVLRGIEATERLPRDVDGRVHTPMIISVRQFG